MATVAELTSRAIQTLVDAYNSTTKFLEHPIYNVAGFGAKADGSDDSAAIQAAIDACPEKGKVVLPPGLYVVNSTLKLHSHIIIEGSYGIDEYVLTMIKFTGTGNLFEMKDAVYNSNSIQMQRIVLEGVTTNSGVSVASQRARFFECTFKNFQTCVKLTTLSGNIIETIIDKCHFYDYQIGLHVPKGVSGANTDGWLTNCIFRGGSQYDAKIETAPGWNIEGNHFYSVDVITQLYLEGYLVRILGNYFEDCAEQIRIKITSNIGAIITSDNLFFMNRLVGTSVYVENDVDVNGLLITDNLFRGLAANPTDLVAVRIPSATNKVYGAITHNHVENYTKEIDTKFPFNTLHVRYTSDTAYFSQGVLRLLANANKIDITAGYGIPAVNKPAGSLHLDYQNGKGYISYGSAWAQIPRAMSTVNASAATDVATLKNDYNTLVQALKDAKVIF